MVTLPETIAAALNLPRWAPKLVRQVAVCGVVAMAVLAPAAYHQGVHIAVEVQRERIEKRITPVIEHLLEPVQPTQQPRAHSGLQ